MRKHGRSPKLGTIDETVVIAEGERKARERKEAQRRVDLSRALAERAIQGEKVGITGFMAIGFPQLTPDMQAYKEMTKSIRDVQRIKPGSILVVGERGWSQVFGVKADTDNEGVQFNVKPKIDSQGEDSHYVEADVMCARAVYDHRLADEATMHGTDEAAYGVSFIDTFVSNATRSVRPIIASSEPELEYHLYADGGRVYNPSYVDRLLEELSQSTQ